MSTQNTMGHFETAEKVENRLEIEVMEAKYQIFEDNMFNNLMISNLDKGIIDYEQYREFLNQHRMSTIQFTDNEFGFYFHYINKEYKSPLKMRTVLGGGRYRYKRCKNLTVEIILFIDDGVIYCMEGHGYGDYIDKNFFVEYEKDV